MKIVNEDGRKHAKNIRYRPRKLGDVGSSSTGSDIFRVFSSIFVENYKSANIAI